jgi:hypothetical protein
MDIEFGEYKNELNLTLFVLLVDIVSESDMKRVLAIRDRLSTAFHEEFVASRVPGIKNAFGLRTWGREQKGRRLYVYPKRTIHFSMLNGFTVDLNDRGFRSERRRIERTCWFECFKKFFCERARRKLANRKQVFEIRGILDERAPSIALKAYPTSNSWLNELRDLNRLLQQSYPTFSIPSECEVPPEEKRLKSRWDGKPYFSMNVLRFLRVRRFERYERPEHFSQIVAEENYRLHRDPIETTRAKPVVVISDAYLSNLVPLIC